MLLIEFLGLPGSGKTTLANAVAERLQPGAGAVHTRQAALADGKPALVRHAVRARYVISSALRQPGLFIAAFRLIRRDSQKNAREFAKVCWNMWCVLGWYVWLGRDREGIAIVDQGIMQAIWSVRLSAVRGMADWPGFVRRLDVIDGVVAVECDPETLAARLDARERQASRLSDAASRDRLWDAAQCAHERTFHEAGSVAPVLRIGNTATGNLHAPTDEILSWLKAMGVGRDVS